MSRRREWAETYVWDKVRVRTIVETEKGKVTDMLVQLEINEDGWQSVVRYNFAHGTPHMDRINKDGRKEKIWLHGRSLDEILTYAGIDVGSNWRKYLKECGYNETY